MGGPDAAAAIASPGAGMGAAEQSVDETAVTIADVAFTSAGPMVVAGTTVTWANEDWAPRTATIEDGSFDSSRLYRDATFEPTFDEPGTFAYSDNVRPGMMGNVVVT